MAYRIVGDAEIRLEIYRNPKMADLIACLDSDFGQSISLTGFTNLGSTFFKGKRHELLEI